MSRKSQEVSLKLAELLGYKVVQTLPIKVDKPGADSPCYWNPYYYRADALEAVAKIRERGVGPSEEFIDALIAYMGKVRDIDLLFATPAELSYAVLEVWE